MRILAQLELINFQSYVYQLFTFTDGLNVVRGASFSGKSALIRALDFLHYSGKCYEDYLRKGTKSFTIKATYSDGLVVTREKGTKVNKYTTLKDGSEEVYENFGTEVPLPVKKLLGINELVYDQDKSLKLNIVNQFDPLFLFTEPGSVKAKVLGLLSKVHLVDICLRGLNRDVRSSEEKFSDLKTTLDRYKEEEKQYDNLSRKLENIQLIQQLVEKIEELNKKSELVSRLGDINKNIRTNEGILVRCKNLCNSVDVELFQKLISVYQECSSLLIKRQSLDSSELKCKTGISSLSMFKCGEFEVLLLKYSKYVDMAGRVKQVELELTNTILEYTRCEDNYIKSSNNYRQSVLSLGVCPICSTKITEKVLQKHLEEL